MDLGAMAMKGYSEFPKAPASGHSLWESYSSAEKQSVYSACLAGLVTEC